MTRFAVRLLPCFAFGCLLVQAAVAAPLSAQGYGRIAGRVTGTESRVGLTGAHIVVRGTSYEAVSGENGRFVIPRVPAGGHTVVVTYIGRTPVTQQVTVNADQTAELDVSLGTVQLQARIIEGMRAQGQAEALTRQKNAPNITNVVAADQMGRFPDASAPEAVQRLPGVALERDQGEGRYIQIRGGAASNTQVTVNGEQIPSPEAEVRQIALDAIPVGVLEAIEVAKAITPDMDADAIGGAVNLITKKAPEGRTFSMEGASSYAMIREDYSGNGSLTLGNRFAGNRLGMLFSGSYGQRNFGSDDLEPDYDLGDAGSADDVLSELEVRHYTLWRSRLGLTGALDYRLGDNSTLYFNTLFSELQDEEQRRRLVHNIEDEALEFVHKNRLEKQRTLNLSAGGDHLFRSGIRFDYRAAFTRSGQDTPYDDEIFFLSEDVTFSPSIADPDKPQTNPDPSAFNGPYLFDEATPGVTNTEDRDWVGGLNLTLPFRFGGQGVGSFKFGGKYRDKKKDQNVTEREFGLGDDAADIVLGSSLGRSFGNGGYNPGSYPIPFTTSPGEVKSFISRFGSQLEGEPNLEAETNEYLIRERVGAVYAMGELNFTPKLLLLPGVRFEHTRLSTTGYEYDSETDLLSPRTGENDYGNLFPMLHLRYRFSDRTNLRAAFTTAIFRPNFVDLIPFRVRDDEDLTLGNPALEPTTSRNYDLLFEHYDQRIGVLSAGVFYKQIVDPIFLFTTDNTLGGETTQPQNSESGWIRGFETAFQRQLTFLPAPWDGFGVFANYTYTDSEAAQQGGVKTRLPGQAKHVYNLATSYEKRAFSGQVSLNYTGNSILELGGDRTEDLYADDRMQVDVSASYFVTSTTQLFVEALNLGNRPYRTYLARTDRPRQIEYYEPSLQIGLRFRP